MFPHHPTGKLLYVITFGSISKCSKSLQWATNALNPSNAANFSTSICKTMSPSYISITGRHLQEDIWTLHMKPVNECAIILRLADNMLASYGIVPCLHSLLTVRLPVRWSKVWASAPVDQILCSRKFLPLPLKVVKLPVICWKDTHTGYVTKEHG